MSESQEQAGTVETKAETKKSPADFFRHWMQAIELAGNEEQDWRKDAEDCLGRYKRTKGSSFNILYANTQTTVPALYNSEPSPDVRRRWNENDPDGKAVSQVVERITMLDAELYDLDSCLKAAVKDRQLPGRGVTRLRVKLTASGQRQVIPEHVQWDDFRRGPAKRWPDVPWVAFRHQYTREDLVELAGPEIGERVDLDVAVAGADKGNKAAKGLPDMFKRATVWEIWDKAEAAVYFIAESFHDGPLKVLPDPYELRDFFPVPRPLYAVELTDSLVPVCEYQLWKPLADEMDNLTKRIAQVVKVMKLRGLYDGAFAGAVSKLGGLDDGELAGADDAGRAMAQGGIDKAIWMWPVDMAIKVVEGLYAARQQAKEALYEMTGVADIMRGETQASETLGAQRIKAQWGSLRLQEAQRDVQRYARDLIRMIADLEAKYKAPAELAAMTGIQLTPQQARLMQSDMQREFAIDIETDSTIRADLSRAQENISGFVTGFGAFVQAIGPAVQAQMMPPEIAVGLLQSFARNFKLGREAEVLMDQWIQFVQQKAQQPPQPDPAQQAKQAEADAKVQQAQMDMQASREEHGMKMQQMQAQGQLAALKTGLATQQMQAKVAAAQAMPPVQPVNGRPQ